MPSKAERFCRWSGCAELSQESYCAEHMAEYIKKREAERARYSKTRDTSSKRGYDSKWEVVRIAYLAKRPVCEQCHDMGLVVPAVLVHHIVPIKDGGARLHSDNLRSLCSSCHENVHRYDRWKKRTSK